MRKERQRDSEQDHDHPKAAGSAFLHYNGPYELYDGSDVTVSHIGPLQHLAAL